jgi:hypothetical protein
MEVIYIQILEINVLHQAGRLFQQYIVDKYAQIDQDRLQFLKNNQNQIRAELYQGVSDHIDNNDGLRLGRRTILPSSYIGGQRNMAANYQDSMSIVRKFGKPDLFITMTCNPKWIEIKDLLLPHQKPEDRPDIVVRVFKIKLERLIDENKMEYLVK